MKKIIVVLSIIVFICIGGLVYLLVDSEKNDDLINENIDTQENLIKEDLYNNEEKENSDNENLDIDEDISKKDSELIPLKLHGVEEITGAELININNYEVCINQELIAKGYKYEIENDILTIMSDDEKYKCVMFQICDEYVMPTEAEIDAFFETEEYEAWSNEDYDYDDEESYKQHYKKYDEISINYYKNLGYTAEKTPDYVLTSEEQKKIVQEYLLEGESNSSGSNGLFPGYENYENYEWGRVTSYMIPKSYDGWTSNFSGCIYFIEYFDENRTSYVDLWTL